MRPRLLIATIVTGAVALAAAPASAAAPTLSLKAADRAADRHADRVADAWRDGEVDVAEADLDACERTARRSADCTVTYILSDGVECADTLHVTRRSASRSDVRGDDGAGPGGSHCWDPQEDDLEDGVDGDDENDPEDDEG